MANQIEEADDDNRDDDWIDSLLEHNQKFRTVPPDGLTMTQTFSQKTHLSLDSRAVGLSAAVLAVLRRMSFLTVVAAAAVSAALFRLII